MAQGLLMERGAEFPVIVMLITAPGVVHKHIESSLLVLHAFEQRFYIGINRMIAADGNACAASRPYDLGGLFDCAGQILSSRSTSYAAARDVNGRACGTERGRDSASGAAAGARNHGDFAS
jgi:hypothetical protein